MPSHQRVASGLGWSVGPPDADEAFGDDDDAAGQVVQVVIVREVLEEGDDVGGLLIAEAEEDDAAVRAGWVEAGVAEAEVEGDEDALVGDGASKNVRVGVTGKVLVDDGVDVVAGGDEWVLGGDGDVLVELDPHGVGVRVWTSCLASQAP